MGFDMNRFELLVEPKAYYRNGNRVNSIGEVMANFYNQREAKKVTHFMAIPINLRDLVRKDVLQSGVHRIPFDFYLQNAFLPTFKVSNGHIEYYVEAMVDKKFISDFNYTTRMDIKVKANSNVCPPNAFGIPVSATREKLIRPYGYKIGSLRLSVHLDTNVFFCGEVINVNFHLDNRSPKVIRFLPQLVQKTAFKHETLYLDSQKLIASNFPEVCRENSSQSDIVSILIPMDCVSTVDSPMFEVRYAINLFVDISGSSEYFNEISILIK